METIARTLKIGGSLIVTIPKEIVREEGLREGEAVKILVEKVKKDYFGILKGMRPFSKEDEIDTHV